MGSVGGCSRGWGSFVIGRDQGGGRAESSLPGLAGLAREPRPAGAPRDIIETMPGQELMSLAEVREVLERSRTVAVLGAHVERERAAFYVPDYLHAQGYRIIPVNPRFAGRQAMRELWEEPFRSSLAEVEEEVDLVDVFRASGALFGHLDDLLAMRPAPGVVWFQLGIRNDAVARELMAAGIDVVQDRCTLADHRDLGLGAPRSSPR